MKARLILWLFAQLQPQIDALVRELLAEQAAQPTAAHRRYIGGR